MLSNLQAAGVSPPMPFPGIGGPARMGESLRTQEPVSHFHTMVRQEFHHSWTFFLWASIGSTQGMGHRSPLPDPMDLSDGAASSGLFQEGWGCPTWDPRTTILSAFSATILAFFFPFSQHLEFFQFQRPDGSYFSQPPRLKHFCLNVQKSFL